MEKPIGPLKIISPIKYSFLLPALKVPKSLFIKFGTFKRANKCKITVKLEVLGYDSITWSINAIELKDNAYHEFPITKAWEFSNDTSATITVHCHSKQDNNSIAVFYDDEGKGNLILGTNRIPGMLVFDFDFAEDLEEIQKNLNKSKNEKEIPGQFRNSYKRNLGFPGLISVVCDSEEKKVILKELLNKESYSNFEIIKKLVKAQGEFVLQSPTEWDGLEKANPETFRNIENALYDLRDSTNASYALVNGYPNALLSSLKSAREGDFHLNGRWSANERYIPQIKVESKNKLVVYTALIDNYDELYDDFEPEEGVDYICFTNSRLKNMKNWEIRRVRNIDEDGIKTARMYKILPHRFLPEYNRSIWMDSNFEIKGELKSLSQNNGNLVMMKHDLRNCIYDEHEACSDLRKDDPKRMLEQIKEYKNEGYPTNNGLVMSGCIIRSHLDPIVIDTMEDWWKEVKLKSCRDQLSFNYVAWKKNTPINYISHKTVLVDNFHKAEHKRKNKKWLQK